MKKFVLASIALIGLGSTTLAADMRVPIYNKAPVRVLVPVQIYNWTGFYIGGHIGGLFGHGASNFMGGGQIGADYQLAPNWVVGIEANYSAIVNGVSDGVGSVTGRVGYAWNQVLIYAKGGYSWYDPKIGRGRDGYTIGGGVEYMFAPNWSTKLEYQYHDFGRLALGPFSTQNDGHTLKLGVNYRFTWRGLPSY